jgi:hypothetical protein
MAVSGSTHQVHRPFLGGIGEASLRREGCGGLKGEVVIVQHVHVHPTGPGSCIATSLSFQPIVLADRLSKKKEKIMYICLAR